MSITRADTQASILRVAGPWFALVGLDATTVETANADLDDAFREAFAAVDGSYDDFASLADADRAKFVAYGTLAALDLALLRWDVPNEKQNNSSQDWGSLLKELRGLVDSLRARVDLLYGTDPTILTAGSIRVGSRRRTSEFG